MFEDHNVDKWVSLGAPRPVKDLWACLAGIGRLGIRMGPSRLAAITGSTCSKTGHRHGIMAKSCSRRGSGQDAHDGGRVAGVHAARNCTSRGSAGRFPRPSGRGPGPAGLNIRGGGRDVVAHGALPAPPGADAFCLHPDQAAQAGVVSTGGLSTGQPGRYGMGGIPPVNPAVCRHRARQPREPAGSPFVVRDHNAVPVFKDGNDQMQVLVGIWAVVQVPDRNYQVLSHGWPVAT